MTDTAVRPVSSNMGGEAKKRKHFTRSATGCRSCREQRVKCPEGPEGSSGRKIQCRRCWEIDERCFYPAAGRTKRSRSGNGRASTSNDWEAAEEVEHWPTSPRSSTPVPPPALHPDWSVLFSSFMAGASQSATASAMAASSARVVPPAASASSQSSASQDDSVAVSTWDLPNPLETFMVPGALAPIETIESVIQDLWDTVPTGDTSFQVIQRPSGSTGLQSSPPFDWLLHLLSPTTPMRPLSTFSLAAFSLDDSARKTVSYFERQGCNEIVAAPSSKYNWIFNQLFPRVFATLSQTAADPAHGQWMREWLHASLMHLSYVHRGNVETDRRMSLAWRDEAQTQRQRASCALLRAKMKAAVVTWKTEEYLMGFFIRCVADMLDSGRFVIDRDSAFELDANSTSTFYPSLRDMIALYATLQYTCMPLERIKAHGPSFEMPEQGSDWVEQFVGFSRRMIRAMGEVTHLIASRVSALSHNKADLSALLLQKRAETLLQEMSALSEWDTCEVGKSSRVRRGSMVISHALRIMILCELLEACPLDPRVVRSQDAAIELVADVEPSVVAGFQWPLTIMAVYCADGEKRQRLRDMLSVSLSMSFGTGYRGTFEVLSLCWEAYDGSGAYLNGIAPWRDALDAFGCSIFI